MLTVSIDEAKTRLVELVKQAANGEPFIITKAGKPLVKVAALNALQITTLAAWVFCPNKSQFQTILIVWAVMKSSSYSTVANETALRHASCSIRKIRASTDRPIPQKSCAA
jgi:antitoxin (DNA-binding transcriptional repressor) of toxin-antitoxin stability system